MPLREVLLKNPEPSDVLQYLEAEFKTSPEIVFDFYTIHAYEPLKNIELCGVFCLRHLDLQHIHHVVHLLIETCASMAVPWILPLLDERKSITREILEMLFHLDVQGMGVQTVASLSSQPSFAFARALYLGVWGHNEAKSTLIRYLPDCRCHLLPSLVRALTPFKEDIELAVFLHQVSAWPAINRAYAIGLMGRAHVPWLIDVLGSVEEASVVKINAVNVLINLGETESVTSILEAWAKNADTCWSLKQASIHAFKTLQATDQLIHLLSIENDTLLLSHIIMALSALRAQDAWPHIKALCLQETLIQDAVEYFKQEVLV